MPSTAINKQAAEIRKQDSDELRLIDSILVANVRGIPAEILHRTDDETFRRYFSEDDYLVLKKLITPPRTIAGECLRMTGALKFSGIAGTKKDRAEAEKRLKAAEAAQRKEFGPLDQIVQDALSKIEALNVAVRNATADVTARNEALANLHRFVPLATKELLNRKTKDGASPDELEQIIGIYDDGVAVS